MPEAIASAIAVRTDPLVAWPELRHVLGGRALKVEAVANRVATVGYVVGALAGPARKVRREYRVAKAALQ